ncbi:PDR/VanB family oxidoreductase [Rhodoplanes roseus]|uniref:Oxidoreductase n=1 Tax=Rhodoplanes roseus TaxID=29409 RepID=A0A327L2C9_9BRAD|nr:PDR/VanB family oxidoreductase [Rhodoplanes roseus]RAI44646.1 oxidoreductase [Rhodoplanes roseus]
MLQIIDRQTGVLRAARDLTPDIRLFEIEPAAGFVPPPPGSHLDVSVRIGERPDTRSYSIVGACGDRVYRIAVKRLPHSRGGSAYMWSLAAGARVSFTGPHDTFPLGTGRPEYLLVAGGIGITPIFTMAMALARTGARMRLVYAARRTCDFAFADELREALGERLSLVTSETGGRVDLAAEIATLAPGGELYVCGPIGMLEAAKRAWQANGRPPENLRFETFGSSGRFPTVPFTVKVPRLGLEIAVPENRSLLESLEEAGVAMISDCRKGECGLCALPILQVEGTVDHRDVFFSDVEKASDAKLCTCVSRVAGGSITIDTADRTG